MKERARRALCSILTAALITSMVIPTAAFAKEKEKKQPVAEEEQAPQVKQSETKAEESSKDNGNKPGEKAKKEEPKKSEPPDQEKEPGKPAEKPKDKGPNPKPEDPPGPKPKENHQPEPSKEPKETVPGNNGTVKIDGVPFDSHPNNEPHVGCTFQVDFYNYDKGDYNAQVTFAVQPPSGKDIVLLTDSVFIGEDPADGSIDAQATYNLRQALLSSGAKAHPTQGYHVKLTVHAEGSQGADVKHKVFWVKCGETPPPPPPPPPSDDDTKCPPPSDEETPPVPPKPPTPPTPPVKPVVRTVEVERTAEAEEFLPFTGSELYLLLTVALLAASAGIYLNRDRIKEFLARFRPQPLLQ